MENENDVFLSIKSKKPVAGKFVSYLSTFNCVAIGALLILFFVSLIKMNIDRAVVVTIVNLFLIAIQSFIAYYFEWFTDGKIEVFNNRIVYTFNDVVSVLGKVQVRDELSDITKITVKRNKILVKGTVTHYEPMRKAVKRNVCEILGTFENQGKLLKDLEDFKNGKTQG